MGQATQGQLGDGIGLTMVIRSEAAADYNDLTCKWFGHGEGESEREKKGGQRGRD